MKKILFTTFLFLSLTSALAAAGQTWAEREVVVTPAPPRTQTARAVEVRPVTTQPAPVVTKPAVAPVAAPVVKTPEPEKKAVSAGSPSPKPATDAKKGAPQSQASTGFFQGLLDRWFPKR